MILTAKETAIVKAIRELSTTVEWDEPFACLERAGIYIATTVDEEGSGLVTWEKFEDTILVDDSDTVAVDIHLLESCVARLKTKFTEKFGKPCPPLDA